MLPESLRDTIMDEVAGQLPERVDLAVESTLYLARRT
jgi:hypothetical protein